MCCMYKCILCSASDNITPSNSSPPGKMAAISQMAFSNAFLRAEDVFFFLIQISLKFVPKGPVDNTSALVQVPVRRQAITWINGDPFHRRIYAALGGEELIIYHIHIYPAGDFVMAGGEVAIFTTHTAILPYQVSVINILLPSTGLLVCSASLSLFVYFQFCVISECFHLLSIHNCLIFGRWSQATPRPLMMGIVKQQFLQFTHWGRVTHTCVIDSSHYRNQCWDIVNWTLRKKPSVKS